MAEGYIQVPPDSTGKKTRTANQTIGSDDVHQSGILLASSTTAELADVDAPADITTTEPAVPVHSAHIGLQTDTAATTDTGTFSLIALIKRLLSVKLIIGQTTKSASLAVTVASDQDALQVVGNIASDTGDSGNPVKIGAHAESSPATMTLVADADRVDVSADLDGGVLVKPMTTFGDIKSQATSTTGGTSTALSTFGAVASTRNFITSIAVFNTSATVSTYVTIQDGSGGTALMYLPLPAGGGAIINLPVPLRQPTANTGLYFQVASAATTVYITVVGFQSKA